MKQRPIEHFHGAELRQTCNLKTDASKVTVSKLISLFEINSVDSLCHFRGTLAKVECGQDVKCSVAICTSSTRASLYR